nr:hypothetical protein [Tanacetum cinerariifolium]
MVKKSFTLRPVAHRPDRHSQIPVRTNMNDARPNRTFFNKQAHSYANRPVHRTSTVRLPYRAPWVPIVNRNFPPVNRKFPTGNSNVFTVCCCYSRHVNTARPKAVINRRNWVNDVKASVWQLRDKIGRYGEDKKKQSYKKLKDSEAEHQV